MKVLKLVLGDYSANCYIAYCVTTKETIVIDPGGNPERIMEEVKEKALDVKYIILTHGHGDHIGGVIELQKSLNIPVLAHRDEVELLADSKKNLSYMMPMGPIELVPDILLEDETSLHLGNHEVTIIHTPGHSQGGISVLIDKYLFTGDTLFKGSIGRTDFPGGNYNTLINSIKDKLFHLNLDILILPGHGDTSRLGDEIIYNSFLQ